MKIFKAIMFLLAAFGGFLMLPVFILLGMLDSIPTTVEAFFRGVKRGYEETMRCK